MMRSYSRFVWAILAASFLACGDDEDPVAGNPPPTGPCYEDNTSCLTVQLSPSDMTYDPYYDIVGDRTTHLLKWEVGSKVLSDYGPGQRVMITMDFNPPLVVRYDHPAQEFGFQTVYIDCVDRWAHPAHSVQSAEWTSTSAIVYCMGDCANSASTLALSTMFDSLLVSSELASLSLDFIVPAAYTVGPGTGMPIVPGDLPMTLGVFLITTLEGNTGEDPPVWPGEYTPATPAVRRDQ
jgi:hypothetical protein